MNQGVIFRVFSHLHEVSLESYQPKTVLLKRYHQLEGLSFSTALQLSYLIGKPDPDVERILAEDSWVSYIYAKEILRSPFPMGEPTIAAHEELSCLYFFNVFYSNL